MAEETLADVEKQLKAATQRLDEAEDFVQQDLDNYLALLARYNRTKENLDKGKPKTDRLPEIVKKVEQMTEVEFFDFLSS